MEYRVPLKRKPVKQKPYGLSSYTKQPTMKYLFLTLLTMLVISISSTAQEHSKQLNAGIELDVLPYATGGWFAAAWVGKEHLRIRLLAASVNKPDFTTKKGFTGHHINAYALVADYSLDEQWKGWWLGGGLVLWNSTIQTDAKLQTASFTNYLINGSAGYNISLTKNIYLSPWTGMSIRVAGEKNVPVDSKRYTLPLLNPEASLKLGIWF